jgi:hypothetical protein
MKKTATKKERALGIEIFKETALPRNFREFHESYIRNKNYEYDDAVAPYLKLAERTLRANGFDTDDERHPVTDDFSQPAEVHEAWRLLMDHEHVKTMRDSLERILNDVWVKNKGENPSDGFKNIPQLISILNRTALQIGVLGCRIGARSRENHARVGRINIASRMAGDKAARERRIALWKKLQDAVTAAYDEPGMKHWTIAVEVAAKFGVSPKMVVRHTTLPRRARRVGRRESDRVAGGNRSLSSLLTFEKRN